MKTERGILEFRDITFRWQDQEHTLFESLNFQVPSGSATALLGPNGAGKTTIMDISLGWRAPRKGEVYLEGKALEKWGNRARGRFMALVPQDEKIPFEYSVMEYILLGRAPYLPPLGNPGRKDREIAMTSLEETGISDLAGRTVSRLSGGERQLVLLARALTQQPRLLLLDEPASHLDLHNKEKILRILKKLRTRGISLFFTSHDPELVLRLADHAVLLKKGSVVQTGRASDVLNQTNLSRLYQVPVRITESEGRRVLIWGDEEN